MNTSRQIKEDLFYIGASDRRITHFENVIPIHKGVSYNSYVLTDRKTVLFDTADISVAPTFLENLQSVLQERALDYLVIHHVEPDHLALLSEVLLRHPQTTLVCSAQAAKFASQFFTQPLGAQVKIVKEGDTLCTGRHTLSFVAAPMVHWPEVLMTYLPTYKILFSADAFGTFGALSGNLYADQVDFDRNWLEEARSYYANIVGKYGTPVQAVLKKAAALDIEMLCPLHGPLWRKDLTYYLHKYDLWSRYEPEEKAVLLVYGSPYGHTENAATVLANKLADKGVKNIRMYDVSRTDMATLISESFRCSHIVLAAPTYNAGLFPPMETFLLDLKAHQMKNRIFAIVENGTWAPQAAKIIRALLDEMPSNTLLAPGLTLKSALKAQQMGELEELADALVASLE